MEISFDTLVSLLTLFIGGGGGTFFTWRYMSRQQLAKDLAEDREYQKQRAMELQEDADRYKKERNELRDELENLARQFNEFRSENERNILEMKRDIARNASMVECMRPFLCGNAPECDKCVPVTISAAGEVSKDKH